ncbi:hypothetical protein NEF87_004188 [Candidatus Lokiarchaeum ossiferum]|uniref:FUZ/MON1/HPS1 first Longin domain-containing protein n=1 Tax=Candidatus Lokiarchaeum ossiferum TaxID=2951803 RepID=A0ABY6HWK3_9ARCH|nr:hypothetical protein NEF87_004188 [Candidatus Lokiarchaeum sp. B-35]
MKDVVKFWIIHKESGMCIFEQTFQELPTDVDSGIITGYLYAIMTFSSEIAHRQVSFLQLEDLRFTFSISEKYIMVIVILGEKSHDITMKQLKNLQIKFDEKYHKYFDKEFSGNVSTFYNFAEEVEKSFQSEAKYFQYLQDRHEQLKNYLQSSTNKWKDLQKIITSHLYKPGSWIKKHSMHIDDATKKNIIETRELTGKKVKKKNSSNSEELKGKWI